MKEKIPTLEEFTELVKNEYMDPEWVVSEEDKLSYFNSEEAQNHIKSEYEQFVKEYNDGELGVDGFRIGCVASVANCLYMMWE